MTFALIDPSSGHLTQVVDSAIDRLFSAGASDITIQSDDYIWAYINRRHVRASTRRLDDGELSVLVRHLYKNDGALGQLGSGRAVDFDADIRPRLNRELSDFDPDYSVRCRVNLTACRVGNVANGYSFTLRTIPGIPPDFKSLKLPQAIAECFFPSQGLVIVAGITGSGKSTLLASAMCELLKRAEKPVKIGTFEDPIEFIYPRVPVMRDERGVGIPLMPEVSQVQIGSHLKEFELAAPNALRRKFDVLVMGEMRDKLSVETGLLFGATGHATYGTIHCETPAEVIGRIISEFPYDAQPSVANKLLANLRVVVAQKIERNEEGRGTAFRSWCIFDQAFKAELYEVQHQHWGRLIQKRMHEAGSTFAQQAYGPFTRGEISVGAFENIAGFNPVEAREYLRQAAAQQVGDGVANAI